MVAVEAVVFDAYGTLFDVHSVSARCESLFPGSGIALSRLWRAKQLEYTWLRSMMQRYECFDAVTADALRFACDALGLQWSETLGGTLMQEYLRLQPYPEVAGALSSLSRYRRAILSNGSLQMLAPLVAHAGLAGHLDAVLSVDRLRVFKPDPRVYQSAVDLLEVRKERIAFVSSNAWDIAGATHFGLRTFWIRRGNAPPERLGARPEATVRDLNALAALL